MQPIKVEYRDAYLDQAALSSDGWHVVGRAHPNRKERRLRSGGPLRRVLKAGALFGVLAIAITGGLYTFKSDLSTSVLPTHELLAKGWDQLDGYAAWAGLGLHQISLRGHRYASDQDIFHAVEKNVGQSLLSVDIESLRRSLENIAWIRSVEITREFPDNLSINVRERRPFAVWRSDAGSWLIDESGHKLASIGGQEFRELPLVSGARANLKLANFYGLLGRYPELRSRVAEIEYVSERRWRLVLTDGGKVELPSTHAERALSRLDRLVKGGHFLTARYEVIDLRIADRVSLRERRGGDTLTASDVALSVKRFMAPQPDHAEMRGTKRGR